MSLLGGFSEASYPEMYDLLLKVLVLEETVLLKGVVSDVDEHLLVVVPIEDLGVIEGITCVTTNHTK